MTLFIGAHLDDVELSCGGMIAKMKGDCRVLSLSHIYDKGNLSGEFRRSMDSLGVEDFSSLSAQVRRFHDFQSYIADSVFDATRGIETVFTHDVTDRHPDHRIVAEQVKRVFNGNLFTFISTWNGNENPNYFVELSENNLSKKIQAIGCYKSQAERQYMDAKYIYAHAIYNGALCGKKYAEGFKIERFIG